MSVHIHVHAIVEHFLNVLANTMQQMLERKEEILPGLPKMLLSLSEIGTVVSDDHHYGSSYNRGMWFKGQHTGRGEPATEQQGATANGQRKRAHPVFLPHACHHSEQSTSTTHLSPKDFYGRHEGYSKIRRQFIVKERTRASKAGDLDSGMAFAV